MNERFLRKPEIAARFGTSAEKARSLLEQHGVYPVHVGKGRNGGLRWLASAVDAVIMAMHRKAQPQPRKPRLPAPDHSIADMGVDSIHKYLETWRRVQ